MDEILNKLADQAGTMTAGLGIILDCLATTEHRLTDLRADLAGTADHESDVLLEVTDGLAQLADYVTDLRARTAPADARLAELEQDDAQRRAWLREDLARQGSPAATPHMMARPGGTLTPKTIRADAGLGYTPGQLAGDVLGENSR